LASFGKEGDMRRFVYVLALGLLGGGGFALAASGDQAFVDKAAMGGMAEVKLSKLAMDKGQSTDVKQFARKMVEDHTKANMELKQIAEKKNLVVPTKLDPEHEKAYNQLATLDGANFDKEYMRVMATDHDDATKLFKEEAQRGQDAELKSFAMKTLPTIEKHDDLAHMDQSQMGAQPVTQPPLPRK
jgi:putative membrane protein